MNKLNQIYKCNICGNIVEVLHAGIGQLVCCGQPMELLQEKTEDVGLEKHVPVVEKTKMGIKVKVGKPIPVSKNLNREKYRDQRYELAEDIVNIIDSLKYTPEQDEE